MDPDSPSSPDKDKAPESSQGGLGAFWSELKRRKVMRVAITYAVVGWAIMQVADLTFEGFGIPIWAFRFVMLCVILGFPIAIILAWAFDLTPDGIKTTKKADVERGDTPVSEKQQRKRNWFTFLFGAAVPTVIFGALAIFFYFRSSPPVSPEVLGGGSSHQVEDLDKSIAVLPLENMSPDPDNAFFADGVQEDILTNLSKLEDLRVIARTSTLQYKDTVKTVQTIGKELGVSYLVEGSVRRAANRVKVTVQLIDCGSGDHLWADDYDRSLHDIFAIQAEVAKQIAGQLKAAILPEVIEQIEARPTESQEAYDSYIKFRNMLVTTGGSLDEKIALLENAVAHDPEFTEAWASLAIECIFSWEVNNRKDPKLYARAYEAIEQAKRSDPDHAYIPYALSSFALREHRDPEQSIDYLLQALAIDPSLSLVPWRLGARYIVLGRLAEAQHNLEIAVLKDPLSYLQNWQLIHTYANRGLWEQVFALIEENLKRSTDSRWLMFTPQYQFLKSGDKEAYRDALVASPRNEYWSLYQLQAALIDRDHSKTLDFLREANPADGAYFMSLFLFQISRSELAAALIHFVRDEEEEAQRSSENAKAALEGSTVENPNVRPEVWSELAICYALKGRTDLMEEAIRKTRETSKTPYYQFRRQAPSELHIAIAYLVLGDHDKAIETLEAASKMDGPIFLNRELDLWFIFDGLRGNPRFDALLED